MRISGNRADRSARSSRRGLAAAAILAMIGSLAAPAAAQTRGQSAQEGGTPSLPGGPALPPAPRGAGFGSGNYLVTSAANEHGAFLWVVDSVQQKVTLCAKTEGQREFTCTKKPLP
jgi:hypothetical protein